jgi:hypothetical protein
LLINTASTMESTASAATQASSTEAAGIAAARHDRTVARRSGPSVPPGTSTSPSAATIAGSATHSSRGVEGATALASPNAGSSSGAAQKPAR